MSNDNELQEFILLKDHRHNGVWHVKDTPITLPKKLGDWLVSQSIARRAGLVIPASVAAPKAALLRRPPSPQPKRRCCGW